MDGFGDLLARERRDDTPALATADGRTRSYRELLTNAYKAGNALRHMGVREGVELGVAPVPALQPLLGFLGAGLLGAVTRFDPDASAAAGARALLVPTGSEAAYDPDPSTKLAVFGDEPARPETRHWEETMWSENPSFPPTTFGPETPVLVAGDETWSHAEVLNAATEVAETHGIGADTSVVLRASLARAGTVTAGLVAPLSRGGTVVLPDDTATGPVGDVAVGEGPEDVSIDPDDVPV